MTRSKTTDLVRCAFLSKETRTLDELYKLAQNDTDDNFRSAISKHRIRSTIFSMKKTGEIKRIGDSMYQKI